MSNNNDNLLKIERHKRIRSLVEAEGQVTVTALSSTFEVSEATIRRDLEEMDCQGLIRRTHGGAVRLERAARELPMILRMPEQQGAKQRIGSAAASLIQDGQTIFLGSGTTVLEAARALPPDIRLTVITNSLPIINELAGRENIEMIILGGQFRQSELSMVGHIAEQAVREFRADFAFIGMHAIDTVHGFTNDFLPETMTDRAILEIAHRVVVLADHTKFGRVSSVLVAPLNAASVIITDNQIPRETEQELQDTGLEILCV